MTPGIQPQRVRIKTRRMAPQPLSMTASGGKRMQISALNKPIWLELQGKITKSPNHPLDQLDQLEINRLISAL